MNPSGLALTAPFVLAPKILHGLDLLLMLTIFSLGKNVQTKERVTANQVPVSAFLGMMVLHARDRSAPTIAMSVEHVGPRNI